MPNCELSPSGKPLILPGTPPHCVRAAFEEMQQPQKLAFLSCLDPSVASTANLVYWLNRYGWRVSYAGLDAYRNTLT